MKRATPHLSFSVAVALGARLKPCIPVALAALLFASPAQALAQSLAASATSYPTKPIRFIVPFAAGGGTDFMTRLFAQKMSEAWGQQVVVDNRPDAAGIVGTEIAAKAAADGYTLVMASGSTTRIQACTTKCPTTRSGTSRRSASSQRCRSCCPRIRAWRRTRRASSSRSSKRNRDN